MSDRKQASHTLMLTSGFGRSQTHCYQIKGHSRQVLLDKTKQIMDIPFQSSTAYFHMAYCSDVSTTSAPEVHEMSDLEGNRREWPSTTSMLTLTSTSVSQSSPNPSFIGLSSFYSIVVARVKLQFVL